MTALQTVESRPRQATPPVARRPARHAAVASLARRPPARSGSRNRGDARRGRAGTGRRVVVAVLQPGALVRSRRRDRPDGGRAVCDLAHRPRVDRGRDDGVHARHLCDPGAEPGARRGGCSRPAPVRPAAAGHDGRRDPGRLRRIHAAADGRRGRQRGGRTPLAVDADAGRAAPVAGQRRTAAPSAGADSGRDASGCAGAGCGDA